MYIQIIWLNLQSTEELQNFAELDDVEIYLIPEHEFKSSFKENEIQYLNYKKYGNYVSHLSWLLDNSWYEYKIHENDQNKLNFTISKIIVCGAVI